MQAIKAMFRSVSIPEQSWATLNVAGGHPVAIRHPFEQSLFLPVLGTAPGFGRDKFVDADCFLHKPAGDTQ